MHKIFVNNCSVLFVRETASFPELEGHLVVSWEDGMHMEQVLQAARTGIIKKLEITHKDPDHIFRLFSDLFTPIEAAGGLVKNQEGKILMIYRHEKWDIPKGKLELDEPHDHAALREVEEECGVKNLKLVRPLHISHHCYRQKEKDFLKRTYWYEMSTDFNGNLSPQTEEHITKAEWKSMGECETALKNSYPAINDVFKAL